MSVPKTLELRVHGINNTSPQSMLDLPEDAVEEITGDRLGGFWRRKAAAANPSPGERGHTPDWVEREAYSWGGLSRTTLGGKGLAGKLVAVVVNLLWGLLIPFALVNVAYWSRRLYPGHVPPGALQEDSVWRRRHAGGAWIFRYAALVLTLMTVATATVVFVDLVGLQCQPAKGKPACTKMPDWADSLNSWNTGQRMAVTSIVPLLLVLSLWILSTRTGAAFDRAAPAMRRTSPAATGGSASDEDAVIRWPMLTTPNFWNHSPVRAASAALHAAASGALVVLMCCLHLLQSVGGGWAMVICIVAGVALAASVVLLSLLGPLAADVTSDLNATQRAKRWVKWSVILAVVAYVAFFVVASQSDLAAPKDGSAALSTSGPTIQLLTGAGIALVAAAMTVRRVAALPKHNLQWSLVSCLLAGFVAAPLCALPGPDTVQQHQWWLLGAAAVALGLLAVGSRGSDASTGTSPTSCAASTPTWSERRHAAWAGRGPGVFLALACFLAFMATSALAMAAGDLLNGDRPASNLPERLEGIEGAPSTYATGPLLVLPQLYGWTSLVSAGGILLMIVVVGIMWVSSWRKVPDWASSAPFGDTEPALWQGTPAAAAVRSKRAFATMTHRAERLLGLLLVCILISWIAVTVGRGFGGNELWPTLVSGAHLVVVTLGSLALLGAAGVGDEPRRPLGLLWDLACLVPRAAHPLGPPCYGERAVPEIVGRINESTDQGRKVILSAHSLGAALCVAAVLVVSQDTSPVVDQTTCKPNSKTPRLERIALLTYGIQLRAYFSRIFPELFGPEVLTSAPVEAASLWGRDPWERDWGKTDLLHSRASPLATVQWISLWHLTDFIGFPVFGRPDLRAGGSFPLPPTTTHAEWYAAELDPTAYLVSVLTHGDYPRAPQYELALKDLSNRLHRRPQVLLCRWPLSLLRRCPRGYSVAE